MRRRASVAALVFTMASAGLPCPSLAQAQDKDAVIEMARRRFQEGVKFFDQRRYEEARAAFLQAYALKRHPAVLLNLAQSEIRSNHPLEAARHFSGFLRESSTASPPERSEAEKGLAVARARLGRLQIAVNVAGAELLVDGEGVGQAPIAEPLDMAPGAHVVEAKFAGKSATATVNITAGKTTTTALSLEASSVPAASPRVAPAPAAAPTPSAGALAPGTATELPSALPDRSGELSVTTASIPQAPEGREPFFSWLGHNGIGMVGVGLTGVGLGVFVGFQLAALKAANNAQKVVDAIEAERQSVGLGDRGVCVPDAVQPGFKTACEMLRDNLDKRNTDRNLAVAGVVIASASLTATVVAYLLTSNRGATSGSAPLVAPSIGSHYRGLTLSGSF